MKPSLPLIILFVGAGLILSCSSNSDVAKTTVENFFVAATDSTSGHKPSEYYPTFDSLGVMVRSDVLDIADVNTKKDTMVVSCMNSYTDIRGVFRQDSVKFYLSKSKKTDELQIINSTGLVSVEGEMKDFAESLGLLPNKSLKDMELTELMSKVYSFYFSKSMEAYVELYSGVKITSWDWETYFDGEPHGQAWIKNNTDVTLEGIKYVVRYFDSRGNFISEDTGTACNKLSPGEKYRFTFYTSHIKYPSTANLKLDFKSSNIETIIYSKGYTKEDFYKFHNDNKSDNKNTSQTI